MRRKSGNQSSPRCHGAVPSMEAGLLALLALAMMPSPADAHPHVLIEARADIQFNAQGQMVGVRNIWDFDEAFSAFAIQGYDSKSDGNPTKADLQPLAEINLQSLAEYGYFTQVKVDGVTVGIGQPNDYYDVFEDEKLTLRFTLPLAKPVDVVGKTIEINVYDPAYFAAITFADGSPVRVTGGGAHCESLVHRPQPLDPTIAGQLALVPADQRTLPPELFSVTKKLVNYTRIICK